VTGLTALQADDPQRVGPYLLLGRLGSGGMGRVYLARSPGGRQVAVKVIRPQLAEDEDFRARFAREVSAARKVGGLFTAQVVDADLDSPVPWLVTAYVPGASLKEAVDQHGPLPAATVLALAAGLAEGLNAIHAAGVIHRDLKPSNVLLAPDGPRIIDFGISSAADATTLTGTGFMIGSPGFMSPEQAEGMPAGPASDIFSLAGVLIFAARGEGPFGGGDTAALLYRVVHGTANLDQLPDKIQPLVSRCLSRDPASRPTAAEFLAELTAAYPSAADLSDWLPTGTLEPAAHEGLATSGNASGASWPHDTPGWGARTDAGAQQPRGGPQPPPPIPYTGQVGPPGNQWNSPLRQPEARRRTRWPWAVGAVAAVVAVIVAAAVLLLGSGHPGTSAGGTASPSAGPTAHSAAPTPTLGEVMLSQLRVGDCLTGANMELNTSDPWPKLALAVRCNQPHTAEVFFADNNFWPHNSPFPGSGAISEDGNAACNNAFRGYVGIAYSKSIYTWTNIIPDASTWPRGDRALHCVAYYSTTGHRAGATLTHSIKGTRR
jgi:eukaryotic-like serine/threonine-protein kinase